MVSTMFPTDSIMERLMSTRRRMEKGARYSRTFTLMSSGLMSMRGFLPLSRWCRAASLRVGTRATSLGFPLGVWYHAYLPLEDAERTFVLLPPE